jgi:hypothetical protein
MITLSMERKTGTPVGLQVFQRTHIVGHEKPNATIFSDTDQLPQCSCFVRAARLDIGYGKTIRSPETPAGVCALRACG